MLCLWIKVRLFKGIHRVLEENWGVCGLSCQGLRLSPWSNVFFFKFFLYKLFLTCMLRWSLTIFLGSVVHYSSCSLKTPLPPFYVCDFLLYPLWYVLFLCSCCLYLKTIVMTSTIPILSYLPQFLTSTITTSHIF